MPRITNYKNVPGSRLSKNNKRPPKITWDRESVLITVTLATISIGVLGAALYLIVNEGRGEVAVLHSQAEVFARCLKSINAIVNESLGSFVCETFVRR